MFLCVVCVFLNGNNKKVHIISMNLRHAYNFPRKIFVMSDEKKYCAMWKRTTVYVPICRTYYINIILFEERKNKLKLGQSYRNRHLQKRNNSKPIHILQFIAHRDDFYFCVICVLVSVWMRMFWFFFSAVVYTSVQLENSIVRFTLRYIRYFSVLTVCTQREKQKCVRLSVN